MDNLQEYVDDLPNICGSEALIEKTIAERSARVYGGSARSSFDHIRSASAIALHMHQPLIPAGGRDLRTAELVSNLQYMMENQGIGDNHNAPVFHWCYRRIGEFIPELIHEGREPRVMLEYSGTLFHGLRKMGLHDVFDTLKHVSCSPHYQRAIEWLGAPWGHAVAPSTPAQDYRLHVRAWQHHFAAIFGLEALARVRGFSPSEMALPNHPDVAYDFVKTLRDCGYQWVLVQEHTIELPETGGSPELKHLPHRLVCTNSRGESVSILAIIKTQGSDTKLVAQMQPYYEARGLSRWSLEGHSVPPLVTQIADGENGGVMMNEFPGKFFEVVREASGSASPLMNVTEYLEAMADAGVRDEDYPAVQPIWQKAIWDRFTPGDGPAKLKDLIDQLKKDDHRFHMDGGSWTSDISWVRGYENVLGPMEEASAMFFDTVLKPGVPTSSKAYRSALYHLMTAQTSCYRYWGQGLWTDYGQEICRRTQDIIRHDFAGAA